MDTKIKFLRLQEVLVRTGLSRSSVYLLINQAKFPAPVKLGRRMSAWVESELDRWLEEKVSARNNSKGGR